MSALGNVRFLAFCAAAILLSACSPAPAPSPAMTPDASAAAQPTAALGSPPALSAASTSGPTAAPNAGAAPAPQATGVPAANSGAPALVAKPQAASKSQPAPVEPAKPAAPIEAVVSQDPNVKIAQTYLQAFYESNPNTLRSVLSQEDIERRFQGGNVTINQDFVKAVAGCKKYTPRITVTDLIQNGDLLLNHKRVVFPFPAQCAELLGKKYDKIVISVRQDPSSNKFYGSGLGFSTQ